MGDWLGLAFWLFLLAIPGAGVVGCCLSIRRSLHWTQVNAVVCADADDRHMPPAQRPRRARTVMFEGPAGPSVAPLGYLAEDAAFPVGSTIRIVVNPANPAQVALRHSVAWHAVGLVFFGAGFAFLLTIPWRMGALG